MPDLSPRNQRLIYFLLLGMALAVLTACLPSFNVRVPTPTATPTAGTPTPTVSPASPTPAYIIVTQTRAFRWLTNTAVFLTATYLPPAEQTAFLQTSAPLIYPSAYPASTLTPSLPTPTWNLIFTNTKTPAAVPSRTRTPTRTITRTRTMTRTATGTGTATGTATATPTATQDARLVAFSADHNADGSPDLLVMNADGSGLRTLVETNGSLPLQEALMNSWSPDNSQIVFEQYGGSPLTRQLYLVSTGGGSAALVSNLPAGENSHAAFSPDGQWVAFRNVNLSGQADLYIIRPNGTELTALTGDANADTSPDWSPDGSKIVYASALSGGSTDLYLLDLSGGLPPASLPVPSQLTSTSGDENWPHFLPSGGDMVLFAGNASAQWEIYTAYLGNWEGTLLNLTSNASADTQPHWSSIASRIVFLSDRSGSREMYMMNFDGSGVLLISNGISSEQQPHWQH